MGWFRASRDSYGPDRFYKLKVLCFAIGGGCGLAGMSSNRDWLVAVGIGFLAVGVVLRFFGGRGTS